MHKSTKLFWSFHGGRLIPLTKYLMFLLCSRSVSSSPVRNVSQSPAPTVRGPVSARPMQGGKQPRRRPPPGGGGGGGDDHSGGPSNGGDTPRRRRSGVPSDRGDLQDAFEQISDRERERLRKKNVQSVTHTSTITTVFEDGRPPSVRRSSTRESPSPNQNSLR